jgi:sulfur-carrier protein adenylyltransferase/sulfurtransferase
MPSQRYHRQAILPEIGPHGQRRLSGARVLCIGAGGLGCGALPYLAGAGIGHITIIDDDRVEVSNLPRQVLFTDADLGRPKAEAAADRLRALNPEISVSGLVTRLNIDNAQKLFEGHDVVIEGSDNFDTKFLAGDAAVKFGVPLVYGSAVGLEAQVTVFDPDHGPCLRCLYPSPPDAWVPNCAENGVLGPLVGTAGCVQASETIKVLLVDNGGDELSPLQGRLWMMDARDMQTRSLTIKRRQDCPCCSRKPADIKLPRPAQASAMSISANEAQALTNALFLDVREPDEWASGHIPDAVNQPLSRLVPGEAGTPATEQPCVVYCAAGSRGELAARLLSQAGHPEVWNLRGGLAAWTGRVVKEK